MGITPSNSQYKTNGIKTFQFIIFLFGGSISLLSLLIILFLQLNKNEKGIISRSLKLITISEIINCIPKLLNSFKSEKEKYDYYKIEASTICYIQFIIQNFVDICTPLLSLIIAREIYYLIDMNELSFFGQKQILTLVSSILIPLIFTFILFLLQVKIWNNTPINKIKNRDYVCYGSFYSILIMIIVILILISFSIYYAIKSSTILRQKKNEFIEIEEELISNKDNENYEDESTINEYPTSDKISAKLNKMYKKNLRYPILFSIIWLIFFFCRGIDIYNYKTYTRLSFLNMPIFFAVLNFFMTVRGLFYCVAFFSKKDLCSNYSKKTVGEISLTEKKDNTEGETIN